MNRFNPRPSLRTGATEPMGDGKREPVVFQSSPVSKDGRYRMCASRWRT